LLSCALPFNHRGRQSHTYRTLDDLAAAIAAATSPGTNSKQILRFHPE
jgi:hypothetical protein